MSTCNTFSELRQSCSRDLARGQSERCPSAKRESCDRRGGLCFRHLLPLAIAGAMAVSATVLSADPPAVPDRTTQAATRGADADWTVETHLLPKTGDGALRGITSLSPVSGAENYCFAVGTGVEDKTMSMVWAGGAKGFVLGDPGEVLLFAPGEKQPFKSLARFPKYVYAIAANKDGTSCCALSGISGGAELFVINVKDGKVGPGQKVDVDCGVHQILAFAPGPMAWVLESPSDARKTHMICLWTPGKEPNSILQLPAPKQCLFSVTAQSCNQRFYAIYQRELREEAATVVVLDLEGPQPKSIAKWTVKTTTNYCWLAISNDGRKVGMVPHELDISGGDQLLVLDASNGAVQRRLSKGNGSVGHVEFSPDSALVVSGAPQGTKIFVWNVTTGRQVAEIPYRTESKLQGYMDTLHALVFSPDGKRLLCGTECGALHLIKVPQAGPSTSPTKP